MASGCDGVIGGCVGVEGMGVAGVREGGTGSLYGRRTGHSSSFSSDDGAAA